MWHQWTEIGKRDSSGEYIPLSIILRAFIKKNKLEDAIVYYSYAIALYKTV
jgi:hypothetical protein